jgi:hypothetical protein
LILFSDEAWFYLSCFVNSQNYRTWSAYNPHNFIGVPLHPIQLVPKANYWSHLKSINIQRYQKLLLEPLMDQLDHVELTNDYFQQNLATAHTAGMAINFLLSIHCLLEIVKFDLIKNM